MVKCQIVPVAFGRSGCIARDSDMFPFQETKTLNESKWNREARLFPGPLAQTISA